MPVNDGIFSDRIFTEDLGAEIWLQQTTNVDGDTVLEMTVDRRDEQITVKLDDYHLHQLLLALTRYEKHRKAGR